MNSFENVLMDYFYLLYSSFGNLVYSLEHRKSKSLSLLLLLLNKKFKNVLILYCSVKPFPQSSYPTGKPATAVSSPDVGGLQAPPPPPWEGRAIATHKLRLVEFSAFMEQHRDADTVSI